MSKLILPGDPDFNDPNYKEGWGDALPPKEAMKKKAESSSGNSYALSGVAQTPFSKTAQVVGDVSTIYTNPMWFSPLHTPQSWQTASRRREIYQWDRHFFENEPKVAAGISFYSEFPINGFKLRWPEDRTPRHGLEKKLLKLYEKEVRRLNLVNILRDISSEYYMIGDVFIHTDISCEKCLGTAIDPETNEVCNHAGGTIGSIKILNPDWIEVLDTVFSEDPQIVLIPDDHIVRIVTQRQPKAVYDRIPDKMKTLILSKKPIPLSSRVVSHLKHMAPPYGSYGTSLIRRLFTTLAYKTKIMTANWIVAERLIIPIRVVKIGSDNRPATSADIAEMQQMLSVAANDPNLTLVTHHNFEYDWYGACHDEETEVLTNNGFMKYYEVMENDKIAVLYIQDGCEREIKFEKPLARQVYNYDGEMISFQGRYLDICVTPNHKMLVFNRNKKHKTKRADEVKDGDRFATVAKMTFEKDQDEMYIQDLDIIANLSDLMKMIGYYLSEGYTTYNEKKYQYWSSMSQDCVVNKEYYKDMGSSIKSVFKNSSIKVHEYGKKDESIKSFSVCNKSVSRWFKDNFGRNSRSKQIPRWIKDKNPKYLQILLDTLINGDGSRQYFKSSVWNNYNTISEKLADDIQEIAFRCGHNTQKVYRSDRWTVSWTTGNNGKYPRIKKEHISRVPYKGKVWCFTVPTGFFVTRRNGKITIQGNSGKILQLGQELEHIDKEILDGLMLNQALLNGEMSGYCHSSDTLTLTNYGFKNYEEIDENDKIACYNPVEKSIEYHPYLKKHVYDYNGELVNFHTDKIDILVTPNHRMYVQPRDKNYFEFIEAKDVKPRAKTIGIIEKFEGNDVKNIKISEEFFIPINNYCKIVGFYVSEGSTSSEKRPARKQQITTLNIHQKINGKAREEISSVYKDTFATHYESENSISVYNPPLAQHLSINYGNHSYVKRLPSWIKNLHPKYLQLIIDTMLLGDGCVNNIARMGRKTPNYSYYTSSKQLSLDFAEIAFKCGYSVKISEYHKSPTEKEYFNKKGHKYITRHKQWVVYISRGFKGRYPNLESKAANNNVISKIQYDGKVYCFTVPYGLFVTMRNGKITIQGNSSAQVGVEILIRRIESWRNTLAEWVAEKVFKPIAQMKGWIDKEASEEIGEKVWLYPIIKWNDLNLKDKTQWYQLLMQLHDKQVISTQTLCEELDLKYDQEIERLRYEVSQAGPMGAQLGGAGGAGGMLGGMGGGGGGVSAPGGGAAAPPMGGPEGGMGAPGGAPGGDMGGGMGGAPGGAPGATAGSPLQVMKKGKAKALAEQQKPMQYGQVRFTRIEQEFRKILDKVVGTLGVNTPYYFQYKVEKTGGGKPYLIDFAFPKLKLGAELDGQIWHSSPEQVQHDRQRDYELAMRGWTIVRFDDKTMEESPDAVQNVVVTYLKNALQKGNIKKASIWNEGEPYYITMCDGNLINIYGDELPDKIANLLITDEDEND